MDLPRLRVFLGDFVRLRGFAKTTRFSGSKTRLQAAGGRGPYFGNAPFGIAGFPLFCAFSHLRSLYASHALRGWIM